MNFLLHSPFAMLITLMVSVGFASDIYAKGLLKKARKMHNHNHNGHDHGHGGHKHNHSKFSFGIGANGSYSLGSGESAEGGDEGGGEAGHTHMRLHGGDDHGGGGESGGDEGGGASFAPTIEASAGYQMMKTFRLNANMGFNVAEGLEDPTFGGTFMIPTTRRVKTEVTATVSAPLSKESSELGRMTTIRGNAGPIYKNKRWTLKVQGQAAFHMYSKALPPEEEEEDHDHAAGEDDHDDATGSHADDDHDDHGHGLRLLADDHEAEEAENAMHLGRETMRFGGLASIGYKFSKSWSALTSGTAAMVNHAATAQSFAVYAEVIKLQYAWNALTAFGALTMSGEAEQFAMPSTPAIGFGVEYEFE